VTPREKEGGVVLMKSRGPMALRQHRSPESQHTARPSYGMRPLAGTKTATSLSDYAQSGGIHILLDINPVTQSKQGLHQS